MRIAAATVVIVGDDLACETVARALSAAGVARLRFVRRTGALAPDVTRALMASNPGVVLESLDWPNGAAEPGAGRDGGLAGGPGYAWLVALTGAAVVVRTGFDDDPMLRAAVRAAMPVVAMRGRVDRVDVVSFRRHGPCPHASLDVPENPGLPPQDGAGAVLAAHIAAAEVLALIAGATTGTARARHVRIPLSSFDPVAVTAVDIPWEPECFACGGAGLEMSFA